MKFFNKHKKTFKIIGMAAVAPAAVYVMVVGYIVLKNVWSGYKWDQAVKKWEAALQQPYREDTDGGQTPEETWAMFLDALKKGDVALASKYVAITKQGEYKESLEKAKKEERLGGWIKEMETLEEDKDSRSIEGKAYYSYRYFDKEFKKDLWAQVVFYLNPLTKVWKILVL